MVTVSPGIRENAVDGSADITAVKLKMTKRYKKFFIFSM